MVELFTDGACRGNPGPGGWGVLIRREGVESSLSGGVALTTNNRMELMAVIEGLLCVKESTRVVVTTDSQYVKLGMTQWIQGWKRRGWINSQRKPVKNKDLWLALDAAAASHDVVWCWVRGHSGHRENEMADLLATQAIDGLG